MKVTNQQIRYIQNRRNPVVTTYTTAADGFSLSVCWIKPRFHSKPRFLTNLDLRGRLQAKPSDEGARILLNIKRYVNTKMILWTLDLTYGITRWATLFVTNPLLDNFLLPDRHLQLMKWFSIQIVCLVCRIYVDNIIYSYITKSCTSVELFVILMINSCFYLEIN